MEKLIIENGEVLIKTKDFPLDSLSTLHRLFTRLYKEPLIKPVKIFNSEKELHIPLIYLYSLDFFRSCLNSNSHFSSLVDLPPKFDCSSQELSKESYSLYIYLFAECVKNGSPPAEYITKENISEFFLFCALFYNEEFIIKSVKALYQTYPLECLKFALTHFLYDEAIFGFCSSIELNKRLSSIKVDFKKGGNISISLLGNHLSKEEQDLIKLFVSQNIEITLIPKAEDIPLSELTSYFQKAESPFLHIDFSQIRLADEKFVKFCQDNGDSILHSLSLS